MTDVVEPVIEPVTLLECKEHLRLLPGEGDDGVLDGVITRAIREAREYLEADSGKALVRQSRVDLVTLDDRAYAPLSGRVGPDPRILYLPMPPLVAVEKLEYLDVDGTWQTVDASAYVVDTSGPVGTVNFINWWPGIFWWDQLLDSPAPATQFRVSYTCGYTRDTCPEQYKAAIRRRVSWAVDSTAGGGGPEPGISRTYHL